jgi:hypothetical protein
MKVKDSALHIDTGFSESAFAKISPVAAALDACIALLSFEDVYVQYLVEKIRPHPTRFLDDPKQLEADFRQIASMTSIKALAVLWQCSPYVSPADLALLGLPTNRGAEVITRFYVGVRMWETDRRAAGSQQKYINRAARIFDGAITYGLAKETACRSNLKPLVATSELHKMMVTLFNPAPPLNQTVGTRPDANFEG